MAGFENVADNVSDKADDGTAVEMLNEDEDQLKRSSRSGSKGRNNSHNRRSSGGSGDRRQLRGSASRSRDPQMRSASRGGRSASKSRHHSPKRSTSRNKHHASPKRSVVSRSAPRRSKSTDDAPEFANLDDSYDHKKLLKVSSKRTERSKSFESVEDLKPPSKPSSSRRRAPRSKSFDSEEIVTADDDISPRSRKSRNVGDTNPSPTRSKSSNNNSLVMTSWHSRSTASSQSMWSDDSGFVGKRHSSRRDKRKSNPETPRSHRSASGLSRASSSRDVLYGDEKAKLSKQRSKRAMKPGIESVGPAGNSKASVNTTGSVDVLYGDSKAKKRSSSKRALQPGVDHVSTSGQSQTSSRSTDLLYGDAKAKAKAKSTNGASLSGSSHHTKTSHSTWSTKTSFNTKSTGTKSTLTNTLYGDDGDAKNKARNRRYGGNDYHQPGFERVAEAGSDTGVTGMMIEAPGSSQHSVQGLKATKHASYSSYNETATDDTDLPVLAAEVKKKRKSKRKNKWENRYFRFFALAAILILLVGGGVIAFIIVSKGDDGGQTVTQDASPPSGSTNGMATRPPTENVDIFDPPSSKDCDAIRNNQTIPGQGSQSNLNLNFQINVKGNTTLSDEMINDLMNSIEELFVNSVVGCDNTTDDGKPTNKSDQRRKLMTNARSAAQVIQRRSIRRMEEALEVLRYAIRYASVKGQLQDVVCEATPSPGGCYILLVKVSLLVDGDSSELDDIIYEEYGSGNNIVSKLNLDDSFLSLNVTKITDVTPSLELQSKSPTDLPSVSPSSSPSKAPTSNFPSTDVPDVADLTLAPVTEATRVPSNSPSSRPTSTAVEGPSPTPSVAPTLMPVVGPPPPPTAAPSLLPSNIPSIEPSTVASDFPTVKGSDVPSSMPSESPSQWPTSIPSMFPTSVPSQSPSSTPPPSPKPTLAPSSLPSVAPSQAPSSSPTATFTYLGPGVCRKGSVSIQHDYCMNTAVFDIETCKAICTLHTSGLRAAELTGNNECYCYYEFGYIPIHKAPYDACSHGSSVRGPVDVIIHSSGASCYSYDELAEGIFTYLGEGSCRIGDNSTFHENCWKSGVYDDETCLSICMQYSYSSGFRGFDRGANNECYCFFDDGTSPLDQPPPSTISVPVDGCNNGPAASGPIDVVAYNAGGSCYSYSGLL